MIYIRRMTFNALLLDTYCSTFPGHTDKLINMLDSGSFLGRELERGIIQYVNEPSC